MSEPMHATTTRQVWPAETLEAREERLLAEARARTGYSDFGDPDFLEGLRTLLRAIRDDLDDRPNDELKELIALLLDGRLHAEEGWKRHPETRDAPVEAPLIIIGLPRTGTTAMHKLLSQDPQFQGLERWLAAFPTPRPPRETWAQDPRFQAMAAARALLRERSPAVRTMHYTEAEQADECIYAMEHSFRSNLFNSKYVLPTLDAWWRQLDARPAMRRYRQTLALIGAHDPGKPWLLKNPTHVYDVEAVLEVFPTASIVHTYREPREAIASAASVMSRISGFEPSEREKQWRGQRELEVWAEGARRVLSAEERVPERFFDADYRKLLSAPLDLAHDIYRHFGLEMSALAEARIREWIAANPQNKYGEHHYSLEEYGLTAAKVDEAFAAYNAKFGLR